MFMAHQHAHTLTHAHLFCGMGGGALGFRRSNPRIKNLSAKWSCLGGIDANPDAIRDFTTLTGTPGTVLDLFDRDQYTGFHNHQPPTDWREAGPDDIRQAFQQKTPDVLFLSAPCKGFSGLLKPELRTNARYQALNGLTKRALWLAIEAYIDNPIPLILFENVPQIASAANGAFVSEITTILKAHGYIISAHSHNCGNIGGLAQSRRRFLIIARHPSKLPPFVYQPRHSPLAPVGPLLSRMPRINHNNPFSLHTPPQLTPQTWLRLAAIPEGQDWRALSSLPQTDTNEILRLDNKSWHKGIMGIQDRSRPAATIAGRNGPTNGAYSIPDGTIDPSQFTPLSTALETWGDHARSKTSSIETILAPDNTWHRPYTTAEIAVIQSLIEPEDITPLGSLSPKGLRDRIGQAVPATAAQGIADTIGETFLLSQAGETFLLSSNDIWVAPQRLAMIDNPADYWH